MSLVIKGSILKQGIFSGQNYPTRYAKRRRPVYSLRKKREEKRAVFYLDRYFHDRKMPIPANMSAKAPRKAKSNPNLTKSGERISICLTASVP